MNYPGMWRFPNKPEHCYIYRVPNSIRQVNPEAYTPQLVIIGPLHHSLKDKAYKSRGDITDAKSMGYLNMEAHKKIYLAEFTREFGGNTIDGFIRMIREDEEKIRESYTESTAWIDSPKFVEMILHDSVFILEFIRRSLQFNRRKTGDLLLDENCLHYMARGDLILLENQLPFFILKKLFDPIVSRKYNGQSFSNLVIMFFRFEEKIGENPTYKHFTDLVRSVYVETLPQHNQVEYVEHMYNAAKLKSAGVKFEVIEEGFSLNVTFEKGCLKMHCLKVEDNLEMTLRNVMAFEQCHDLYSAHVCAYINFLDHLIDTEKDVDLLVEKGIIKNSIGKHSAVAEMVNKLCLGIIEFGSYYPNIAIDIKAYCSNPLNKSRAILNSVYFTNLWKGTGTVAAMLLLVMTFIQTIASIMQVKQKDH